MLELAALAALAVWGWHVTGNELTRLAVAVGAPASVAAVWGRFVAPRAPRYLPVVGRLVVEAGVFGTATLALIDLGCPRLAGGLALLAVLNTILVHAWRQDVHARLVTASRPGAAMQP